MTTPTNLIESARHVLEHKQFVTIDAVTGGVVPTPDSVYNTPEWDEDRVTGDGTGIILDAFTASMLVQVFNALGPDAQAKFLSLSPTRCVNICWKLVK